MLLEFWAICKWGLIDAILYSWIVSFMFFILRFICIYGQNYRTLHAGTKRQ